MPDPIYIVGPTASGKSDVAAELAHSIGGEIVGADAFQVYEDFQLLTAKPSAAVLARVPHHLIGEVPTNRTFDVEQYRRLASTRIDQISGRGRVPVVVGGTGLYIRALTHGLAELPPGDQALRDKLAAEPLPALESQLRDLDPVAASEIDLQNPRRVIRALEVCLLTGVPFSKFRAQSSPFKPVRGVLLHRDRAALRERIATRTETMFQSGVVEEVRGVVKRVGEISATAQQAIGFREILALLEGRIDEAECRARITTQTQQYAKRQMTWFRRDPDWQVLLMEEGESATATALRIAELISFN